MIMTLSILSLLAVIAAIQAVSKARVRVPVPVRVERPESPRPYRRP